MPGKAEIKQAALESDLIFALDRAMRQWRMHYEMQDDEGSLDISEVKTAEGDLYRHCAEILARARD